MRFIVLALAGLGLACFSMPASAQTVEWRGGAYLHFEGDSCFADGYREIEYVNMRYRPRGLGQNGPTTRLSFFHQPSFFATAYRLVKGPLNARWKPVLGTGMSAFAYEFEGKPRMRVTTHEPVKLTRATPTVRLIGEIQRYGDVPGCTATFEANLMLRQ